MTKAQAKKHALRIASSWLVCNVHDGCVESSLDARNIYDEKNRDRIRHGVNEIIQELDRRGSDTPPRQER